MQGRGSRSGKLLGKERSPFMALEESERDINTIYGTTTGWEKGKLLVHSIYRGIYTHNTLERGLKDAQSNLKVRTGNVSGDIWQQFD